MGPFKWVLIQEWVLAWDITVVRSSYGFIAIMVANEGLEQL